MEDDINKMTKIKIIPYLIALLCAGFAWTQDVFKVVIDWIGILSMQLTYGWFTVLIIVLFAAWCIYILKVNWKQYHYSDVFTAVLFFFAITSLYYRFLDNRYEFVPLAGRLAYVDILWILSIAFVVEAIVNKYKRPQPIKDGDNSILLDSPIETPKEDEFDYYSEAFHIASTLSNLPESKAVSVAVLSPWGNGKTSFVNLIKYAIKYGSDKKPLFDHVIIEFNPRQSKNIASIQEDFFKTLTEAIPDNTKIRNRITEYLENIRIQDIHSLTKVFTGVIKIKRTKSEAIEEVNSALDSLKKKLIVFIDDFDRLTDAEIIEVLKLIDNNAAFRHTIFITAYDETAISNALRKYEGSKGIAYIDKFFTLRFHLPLRSDVTIVNTMYRLLQNKVDKDIDLSSIMKNQFQIIIECVRNLRDAKSFCNMFMIDYAFNSKHEINFEEYFLLELMKFRYYDDYCRLYKKEYISNRSLFQNMDATYTLKGKYSIDKNGKEPEGVQPRSISILRSIFSDYKEMGEYDYHTKKPSFRSVQFVRYFDMYFTNRNYGHIKAEQLESLYTMKKDKDIIDFYNHYIQQKYQSDIVDFLRFEEWQSITPKGTLTKEDTFKQYVRMVFLYSAISNNNDSYIDALQMQLLYKPNFKENSYNGMDEQAYHDFLIKTIYSRDNADYIPLAFITRFTSALVSPTDEGVKDVSTYIFNGGELKKKNFEVFQEYIKKQKKYTTQLTFVYRLCVDHIANERYIIADEANDVMREFLYKDKSNEYLNGFLIFNQNNDLHISIAFKDPFFKQIFPVKDNVDMFEKYVKETLPEDDTNRAEILAYLKRYRTAGSTHAGVYNVKPNNPTPSHMDIIEGLEF